MAVMDVLADSFDIPYREIMWHGEGGERVV
jgi:hypothetical protein